jgi:ribosomal protein S18 acetylase RimI-like enzyme
MTTIQPEIRVAPVHNMSLAATFAAMWENADIAHYGEAKNFAQTKATHSFIAVLDGKPVGRVVVKVKAGVMEIGEIIVSQELRRHRIGTALMREAERFAQECGVHKILLETGADWPEVGFYQWLGYLKVADIPDHYGGQDFAIYAKYRKT